MYIKLDDDTSTCKGEFSLRLYRNGKLIETISDHNLVVELGRRRLANLAAGLSTSAIKYIGVGTGSSAESSTDSALENQQLFELTDRRVDGRDAIFNFAIGKPDANGLDIRELGLFCEDKTMFTHRVRMNELRTKVLVIGKERDLEIDGEYILHF